MGFPMRGMSAIGNIRSADDAISAVALKCHCQERTSYPIPSRIGGEARRRHLKWSAHTKTGMRRALASGGGNDPAEHVKQPEAANAPPSILVNGERQNRAEKCWAPIRR